MKKKKLLAKLSKATKKLARAEAKVTKLKSRIEKAAKPPTPKPPVTGAAKRGVAEQSLQTPPPAKDAAPAKNTKAKPASP